MNEFRDFTSLPPEEEAQFIVYEQRTQYWSKKALRIGAIAAGIFGILIIIVVFSHEKPENLMADDDIGMLGTKEDMAKQRQELKTGSDTPTTPATTPEATTPTTPEATTPEGTTPEATTPETATPDPAAAGSAETGAGETPSTP